MEAKIGELLIANPTSSLSSEEESTLSDPLKKRKDLLDKEEA